MADQAKPEAGAVNLCQEGQEVVVNYTYTDLGRQIMILDIGAQLSLAGVP